MIFALGPSGSTRVAGIVVVVASRTTQEFAGTSYLHFLRNRLSRFHLRHTIGFIMVMLFWNDEGIKPHRTAFDFFFETMGDRDALDEFYQAQSCFFLHGLFSTTEYYFEFNFVALGEEFLGLCFLEEEIVASGAEADADAFGFYFALLSFLLLFLLGLAVLEFTIVSNLAYRRLGQGGYFHQVSFLFLGQGNGEGGVH